MSQPTLAQVADVQSRYSGTMTQANLNRLPQLLADASATVRSYARQQFTQSTTTANVRPIGQTIKLPQKPVTGVTSVGIVDTLQPGNLLVLPVSAWMWDGGQEIWLAGMSDLVVNLPDEVSTILRYQTPLCQVTYSHGYAVVPDDVVAVVCSMVMRFMDLPGAVGIQYQSVGPFGYRLSATAQEGIVSLTPSEQRILDAYRRKSTTVELR